VTSTHIYLCPRDKNELISMAIGARELWACGICSGVFIKNASNDFFLKDRVPTAREEWNTPICCPEDGEQMNLVGVKDAIADFCSHCGSAWVDGDQRQIFPVDANLFESKKQKTINPNGLICRISQGRSKPAIFLGKSIFILSLLFSPLFYWISYQTLESQSNVKGGLLHLIFGIIFSAVLPFIYIMLAEDFRKFTNGERLIDYLKSSIKSIHTYDSTNSNTSARWATVIFEFIFFAIIIYFSYKAEQKLDFMYWLSSNWHHALGFIK
jgi:hypothetical protein